jgi:hypothetical protein
MRRVRMLGAGLVAVIASLALQIGPASASTIRFPGEGKCEERPLGGGYFGDRACENLGGSLSFEWCWENGWAPGCPLATSARWAWSKFTFEQPTAKVTCGKGSDLFTHGELGPKSTGLSLTGCNVTSKQLPKSTCQSGASPGEIATNAITTQYGYVDAKAHQVGLRLSSPSETIAEFHCGEVPVAVRGGVVASVPANKLSKSLKLTFKAKKGAQAISGLEGEPGTLEISVAGGPYEAAGLTTKISETAEPQSKFGIHCRNAETLESELC